MQNAIVTLFTMQASQVNHGGWENHIVIIKNI